MSHPERLRRRPYTKISTIFRDKHTLRFVINTDTTATNVREFLQLYYAKVWVEYAVRNPLWAIGTPVTSELFKSKSDDFIRQSSMYGLKNI